MHRQDTKGHFFGRGSTHLELTTIRR